jgi:hypothetical protein
MSKWLPTLRRLGRWFLRKLALAVLTSLLFMLSFTLFQYVSWWPALTEDASLVWSGLSSGHTVAELAPTMLEFSVVLACAFLCFLAPVFADTAPAVAAALCRALVVANL